MINISPTEKQLAAMTPTQRKQYVQMHKSNPYIVSMALNIDNLEKAIRLADQARNSPDEQPKVVDQFLAQMGNPSQQQMPQEQGQQAQAMPEDTGIGALPAGDMEFADGGIVGYADGGAVQRFAGEGPSLVRPIGATQGGASVPFGGYGGGPSMIPARTGYEGMGLVEFLRTFGADVLAKLPSEEKTRLRENEKKQAASFDAERQRNMALLAADRGSPTDPNFRRQPDPRLLPGMQEDVGTQSAPLADTGRNAAPGAGQGIDQLLAPKAPRAASSTAPAAATTASDFMSQYEAARKGRKVDDPFAQQEADLREKEEAAANMKIAAFDKDMAERGDFRAGQKERLSKREAELGKERSTLKGLAFLEAGLATMQSTGRGLSGIAQGAGVGVKAYTSGLEKLKTAQEKLDDARDKIAEAQDTESQLTKAQRRDLMSDAAKTTNQGLRSYIAAQRGLLSKDEQLTQTAVASDIATQGRQAQIASAERIAAQNRAALAGRIEGAGGKLDLERLKAQAKLLQDQLKETPNYGPGKAKRAALENALRDIQTQMSGGTITPPSAAAAPGGTPVIDFLTGKPI
jgi:hypothetical protein